MQKTDTIYELLSEVKDPEIPVVNIIELGIIRNVKVQYNTVNITMTPTYSGCPAIKTIEQDIINVLKQAGFLRVQLEVKHSPPWTTDWINEATQKKLRDYGIAPPQTKNQNFYPLSAIKILEGYKQETIVPCPLCDSEQTKMQAEFSSTSCKALYYCDNCLQPFEYFKSF